MQKVASYPGPGGAENAVIAPAGFGSQAGSVLLAVDYDKTSGRLVAVSAQGPGTVLRADAGQFAGHAGEVIVGSETKGLIWLVAPRGKGFRTTLLPTNLTAPGYNLEGATFVP